MKFVWSLILMSILHLQALEIAIVTNSQDISKMDKNEVKRLFLAKTNRVDNIYVNLLELKNTHYKEEFYKVLTNKNTTQLRSYWTRLIFAGKGKPPKQIDSAENLIKYFQSSEVVITYLPIDEITPEMNILFVLHK